MNKGKKVGKFADTDLQSHNFIERVGVRKIGRNMVDEVVPPAWR